MSNHLSNSSANSTTQIFMRVNIFSSNRNQHGEELSPQSLIKFQEILRLSDRKEQVAEIKKLARLFPYEAIALFNEVIENFDVMLFNQPGNIRAYIIFKFNKAFPFGKEQLFGEAIKILNKIETPDDYINMIAMLAELFPDKSTELFKIMMNCFDDIVMRNDSADEIIANVILVAEIFPFPDQSSEIVERIKPCLDDILMRANENGGLVGNNIKLAKAFPHQSFLFFSRIMKHLDETIMKDGSNMYLISKLATLATAFPNQLSELYNKMMEHFDELILIEDKFQRIEVICKLAEVFKDEAADFYIRVMQHFDKIISLPDNPDCQDKYTACDHAVKLGKAFPDNAGCIRQSFMPIRSEE